MTQIKQHSANGRNYLIVQVPKDATDFIIHLNNFIWKNFDTVHAGHNITLPPGQYTLLFIAEEATGEQAHSVVEECEFTPALYKDYERENRGYAANKMSLYSLISSLFPNWADYKHAILERHD